ncbi:DUF2141 domain-containing protein (plasmid) [Pseudoalteromonas sp. T1lg65]|uniref:DUF2141 domain-containing protein n=1 Tax=Pseudoalteromonas sp. T1lg65 TaxID=2077101 RepID=UPI003F792391
MRSVITFVMLLFLVACQSTSPISVNSMPGKPTSLTVEISSVENTDGQILVLLFDNSEDYASDKNINAADAHFFKTLIVKPEVPVTTAVFEQIPAGQYAIHVIHDRDSDGGMDRMLFPFTGMPSEPYAISNNVYNNFSKASFKDALFQVNAPATKISLALSTHLSKMTGM